MKQFHLYLHFPKEIVDDFIDREDRQAASSFVRDFDMTIYLADCEKGAALYYSKENKDHFFQELNVLEGDDMLGNFGSYSLEVTFNILFSENDIVNIDSKGDGVDCKFSVFEPQNDQTHKDFPVILKHAAVKSITIEGDQSQGLLILNILKAFFSSNPITIIVNCQGDSPKMPSIPYVSNFSELDNWFQKNRKTRNYNHDDNRHIENHPQSQIDSHDKSPLIGGLGGKENAASLLSAAVGDKRATKDLINYDQTNSAYIWYEYENTNPQNQYHGYHLVKAYSHERDTKAEKEIPERVKNILDYRIELSENAS